MYGVLLVGLVLLILQSTDLVLSALLLAGCFFTTAFWLAAWGFDYVAVVYQLVYLGAVIVLFLFVVMFLDNPAAEENEAVAIAQQSGSPLPYLVIWLLLVAPFVFFICAAVEDFVVAAIFLDPSSALTATGFPAGLQDVLLDTQLPLLQYFFTQGAALLFFMGLLFTLALFFALFLIIVFAL